MGRRRRDFVIVAGKHMLPHNDCSYCITLRRALLPAAFPTYMSHVTSFYVVCTIRIRPLKTSSGINPLPPGRFS